MGAGYVELRSLMIDGRRLVSNQAFNFNCFDPGVVVRIEAKSKGKDLEFTICHAEEWNWDIGYKDEACDKPLTLPSTRTRAKPARAG
jgi:hypothetical protein